MPLTHSLALCANSFIVDTFQGQLRSDVECNVCGHRSLTFDPFSSLSVGLPVKRLQTFSFFLYNKEGEMACLFKSVVDEDTGSIADGTCVWGFGACSCCRVLALTLTLAMPMHCLPLSPDTLQ